MGMPFNTNTAKALMQQQPGTAAQLLYRIKTAVDSTATQMGTKPAGPNTTKLMQTFGVSSKPSKGYYEATNHRYTTG